MQTPASSRSHREDYTVNYKQLMPVNCFGYVCDLVEASIKRPGPMIVNGKKYEPGEDVLSKAKLPRSASLWDICDSA